MWDLSQDVSEVRVLEEISRIEQLSRSSQNYELAITGYRDLAQRSEHSQFDVGSFPYQLPLEREREIVLID